MAGLVDDIMSKTLQSISPDSTLEKARELMAEKNIRHLLVIDPKVGQLVGILSDRDVKKFLSPFAGSPAATERDNATLHIKLEKVMAKNVLSVKLGTTIKNAVEKMLQKKIGAIPVMNGDESKCVGIVTTSDFLKYLYAQL